MCDKTQKLILLILVPFLWLKRQSGRRGDRLATGTYFLLLGITYMLLKMVLIIKFTHFLGDPILSAGGVVRAFLVFSGLGSLVSRRLFHNPRRAITVGVLGIAAFAIAYVFILDGLFALTAAWPTATHFGLAVFLASPLAFLMGWPFPNGLTCVERERPTLIPWAWGANGVASATGPPVRALLAVASGLSTAMLLAAILYGCAGLVAWALPGARSPAG